jgi:hypothetical protein
MLIRPSRMADLGWTVPADLSEVSLDEWRVARAALRVACKALGLDVARIRPHWICQAFADTEGATRTRSGHPIRGRFNPTRDFEIELRVGRPLEAIRETAYHEVRHKWQLEHWGLPDSEADREWRDADASRWAAEMMRSEGA